MLAAPLDFHGAPPEIYPMTACRLLAELRPSADRKEEPV